MNCVFPSFFETETDHYVQTSLTDCIYGHHPMQAVSVHLGAMSEHGIIAHTSRVGEWMKRQPACANSIEILCPVGCKAA